MLKQLLLEYINSKEIETNAIKNLYDPEGCCCLVTWFDFETFLFFFSVVATKISVF